MIRGAAIAPRIPQAPAAVSTRPIDQGAKPAWISRRSAATKSALTTRLEHIPHSIRVRKNGRLHRNRKPSATSARALRRAPSRGAGERSVRIRPSSTHETAKVTASKRNGAHRVIAYRAPPSGPPTRLGDVLAGLLLAERGRQLLARHDGRGPRTSRPARTHPRRRRVSSATTNRCGTVSSPSAPGHHERRVEEHAGARRRSASPGRGRPGRRAARRAAARAPSRAGRARRRARPGGPSR